MTTPVSPFSHFLLTPRLRPPLVLVSSLVVLVWVAIASMVVFSEPELFISINARAGTVAFDVGNPDLATIPIAGMKAIDANPFGNMAAGTCRSGLLVPSAGVRIGYWASPDGIVITLKSGDDTSVGTFVDQAVSDIEQLPGDVLLTPTGCPPVARGAYPIWGPGQIGEEQRPARIDSPGAEGLLFSGAISIYASSVRKQWFGLAETLYRVEPMTIPPGARIGDLSQTGSRPSWFGVARSNPQDWQTLMVDVTTRQRDIQMILPGDRLQGETIRIGAVVPLFEDPFLRRLQILLAATLALAQTLLAAVRSKETDDPVARDPSDQPPNVPSGAHTDQPPAHRGDADAGRGGDGETGNQR
jgi:hypothetical protein